MSTTSTQARDHATRDQKRTPEGRRAAKAATIARKRARAEKYGA